MKPVRVSARAQESIRADERRRMRNMIVALAACCSQEEATQFRRQALLVFADTLTTMTDVELKQGSDEAGDGDSVEIVTVRPAPS